MFDISNIFLQIFNYELSYLEFFAVITALAAVYVTSLGKVEGFYIGLVNNVLYFIFFYQCQLYSVMFLQVAYFTISSFGIYSWLKPDANKQLLKITRLTKKQWILVSVAILLATVIWSSLVLWLSGKYPDHIEQPQYPYIDALITMISVCGQLILARKKIDNWILWMVVNGSSIVLYAVIGIYFTSILCAVLLVIAIRAYITWNKMMKAQ
jgi:nicotinamide mononucleotide transporter PnuC